MSSAYEPVIGLEIHIELATQSGMFCGCPADYFGKPPNSVTCPVCLGLPGALPVPNKQAIDWTIMLGLVLGCEIAQVSKFDRKHYFYPDLPKGYQISQYDQPLCRNGKLITSFGPVKIQRVHLEEDTGKLQHATINGKKVSLVDFNRSGVPLIEIVTEADITSSIQAKEFMKKLHQMVRHLGISDADMEKGSMRIEPNISLRKTGEKKLPPYKVEVKNINSFRFAAMAIEFELERHAKILDFGKFPLQETRGWDESNGCTVVQRTKEEAADYRYFPEPDIPPLRFSKLYIENIRNQIPALPDQKKADLMELFSINEGYANVLIESPVKLQKIKDTLQLEPIQKAKITAAEVVNWYINRVVDDAGVNVYEQGQKIIDSKIQDDLDEGELYKVISEIISKNQKAAEDYRKGKEQSLMFLMGLVKRQFPKGNVQQIIRSLKQALQ